MLKKLFESDLEREEILNFYVTQKGYRFAGEENHLDGHFLLFDTPTPYHSMVNDEWVIDIDAWLSSGDKPNVEDVNFISDSELNERIENFYYQQVTADTWRKNNYAFLREAAYPDLMNKIDSEVKIASGDDALVAKGQAQLAAYNEQCLDVKIRFPKE